MSQNCVVASSPPGDGDRNHLYHQTAGMEGLVTNLKVKPGDVVDGQQILFTVSAMKMELDVRAPIAGVVKDVSVPAGASVKPNDVVVVINTFLPRKE
ncbi:Biotin-requiring enzyme [Ancylostoma ceylanicum]|uniref:Biotin-requiring enzyme n=2 Tax=Ancylostoma ceylanicum TaxID=53326 RepID=A0A0D6M1M1_9BILA|nr:Biotin-requiring enzyme [Ancylostoma ceylanicum]EYC04867.1 hypothetical protein Y032_0085g1838 [Ancylostoma ceylanicum]